MPLLQESTPKRELLSSREMKVETEQPTSLKNPLNSVAYPTFPNGAMFTPTQIIMASQLMAASGLTGLPTNPAFFHPGLLPLAWPSSSPPSPPATAEQLSPALKNRKLITNNNNNNVVSSSNNAEVVKAAMPIKRKQQQQQQQLQQQQQQQWTKMEEETSLASPTSSSSPLSSTEVIGGRDANRDRPFTCDTCNRSFGYKHVLQNHERTHTGEKPFECQECHKRFTRDHHLKTHMRLHTGERPYHCEHCDRQFVQVANLRRHLRVHTGERPYSCDQCESKFSDSNQLKAHLLIHSNQKPYDCPRCGSRFRRRHHLGNHKCGVPEEEPHKPEVHEDDSKRPRILHAPIIPVETRPVVVDTRPVMVDPRPVLVDLPEQTEPEDLSMSTGLHGSHSSCDSPMSRSPSSREDLDEEEDPQEAASIFLQRRSPMPRHLGRYHP